MTPQKIPKQLHGPTRSHFFLLLPVPVRQPSFGIPGIRGIRGQKLEGLALADEEDEDDEAAGFTTFTAGFTGLAAGFKSSSSSNFSNGPSMRQGVQAVPPKSNIAEMSESLSMSNTPPTRWANGGMQSSLSSPMPEPATDAFEEAEAEQMLKN